MAKSENTDYDNKKMQFGIWLGKPPYLREPRTAKELGVLLGVTNVTLTHWKKDPKVIDIAENYRKLEAVTHLDDIISKMIRRAKDGNAADTRLYLEWLGEMEKSKKEKTEPLGKIEIEFIRREAKK